MLSQDALTGDAKGIDLGPLVRDQQESFFRRLLGDFEEPHAPFGLMSRQGDGSGDNEEAQLQIDGALALQLRAGARARGVSATSVFHMAWALVLARASASEDVVFGTVLYGRKQDGTLAYQVLPIRISLGEETVEASSLRTNALLGNLWGHKQGSLALAQRCSAVQAPTPLFLALLSYHDHQGTVETPKSWENIPSLYEEESTNYPLTLSVDDMGEGFRLTAQAPISIGAMRVCCFMHTALASLAEALQTAPSALVRALNVLPDAERNRVLYEWNNIRTNFPADMCIHELFEEQVRKSPNAPALVGPAEELSYMELNLRANRLAHRLGELGVQPDKRVAICVERGSEMIVAVLAVLKAGGAYVPLDPVYPRERLRFMLRDSAPLALLTQTHLESLFSDVGHALPVLHLDSETALCHSYPDSNLNRNSTGLLPTHLAYLIYTSGSTGTPKGVMVEHANVVRLFAATDAWFHFGDKDVWTLFHSYAFDFSVWEIWGALLYGGRLVLVAKDIARSPEDFYELICREKVTILNQTPSAFKQLITAQSTSRDSHHLRHVIFGGEALEVASLKPWYAQNRERLTRLNNMYGITETTVHVTYRPLEQADTQGGNGRSVGCRIPDLRVYILDSHRNPVPIGVAGELYVGGAGVSRGYLNRAELTAERFLADPFVPDPEARIYKTGDLGRWQPDGSIEFLGRNDLQVKVRGFRIELGEIEAQLAEFAGIREAVVIAREDGPDDVRLVAYYTLDGNDPMGKVLDTRTLRSHLSARLPEYMVPTAYVRLQSLPLTVNGKLDRKALPLPGDAYGFRHYEPPMGQTETALADIWAELLKLDRIGRRDNFFELGGHSLLAARMIARVRASFGTRLPLFPFIQTPTIAYLADLLAGKATQMAVVNKGSFEAIPLLWVAPEAWQPRLTSYLSTDQPVLSFVLSEEELASAAPHYRLEDLAACTVTKILELCPRAAYMLSGFCQTSLLAYECAQQLRQRGYEVPLLIMGDALLPGYMQRLSFVELSLRRLERELFYLSVLRHSPISQWKKLVSQRMGGLRAMRGQAMWEKYYRSSKKDHQLVMELYQALSLAQLSYVPSRYPGRVLYLQSGHRPQSSRWDAAASWEGLIDELEVFEAPGDHTSIFEEPHVRVSAERIQLALNEAQPTRLHLPNTLVTGQSHHVRHSVAH